LDEVAKRWFEAHNSVNVLIAEMENETNRQLICRMKHAWAQRDAIYRLERFLLGSNGLKLPRYRETEGIEIDGRLLEGLENERWARPGSNR